MRRVILVLVAAIVIAVLVRTPMRAQFGGRRISPRIVPAEVTHAAARF